jgi:hypothetical protein
MTDGVCDYGPPARLEVRQQLEPPDVICAVVKPAQRHHAVGVIAAAQRTRCQMGGGDAIGLQASEASAADEQSRAGATASKSAGSPPGRDDLSASDITEIAPAPQRLFHRSMAANPLCPVVLSMLGARPRPIHEVARELRGRTLRQGEDYLAARTTLERLQAAGLAHATGHRTAGHVFRLTARGRRELRFQRLLWARLESTATTAI